MSGANKPVTDGTPRDCSSNGCGSQADTSIIRNRDMKSMPLGKTQGNGAVDPAVNIARFMGTSQTAPTNNGASGSVGQEDDLSGLPAGAAKRHEERKRQLGKLFGGLLGGGGGDGDKGAATGIGGLLGGGGDGKKSNFPAETMVADTAGMGSTQGLPTSDNSGVVSMVYRQINQDGAGPLTASIDATSGGKDPNAFQKADVVKDVPGLGIQGLSLATNTDFPLQVKMPAGMTCEGTVGDATNVCIVRVRNGAAAGPFGGSGAFTQSATARKRAIAYRLKKRMELAREAPEIDYTEADLEEERDDELLEQLQ